MLKECYLCIDDVVHDGYSMDALNCAAFDMDAICYGEKSKSKFRGLLKLEYPRIAVDLTNPTIHSVIYYAFFASQRGYEVILSSSLSMTDIKTRLIAAGVNNVRKSNESSRISNS